METLQETQPDLDAAVAGKPEDKAWPVHIDVHLENDDPANPQFRILSTLPSYKDSKGDVILKFENNHRPGFKTHFHLHDLTGKGYAFVSAEKDAIWSKPGTQCPDTAVSSVFTPLRVVDQGPFGVPMLVAYLANEPVNGEPIGRFQYTLNVAVPGGKPLSLDPGGDAGNGPRTLRP